MNSPFDQQWQVQKKPKRISSMYEIIVIHLMVHVVVGVVSAFVYFAMKHLNANMVAWYVYAAALAYANSLFYASILVRNWLILSEIDKD